MFSGLILPREFECGSEESRCCELDTLIATAEGFASCLKKPKLGVVVGALYEVYNPRKPALLFYCLICFNASPWTLHSWITAWLLHALFNEDLQDFQYTIEVIQSRYLGLIS